MVEEPNIRAPHVAAAEARVAVTLLCSFLPTHPCLVLLYYSCCVVLIGTAKPLSASQSVSQSVWEEKQASKLLTHLYYSGEDQRKVTTHMAIPLLDPTMPMLAATITITTTNITILLRLARKVCLKANSFSRYSENRTAHAVNDRGFGERLGIIWLTLL